MNAATMIQILGELGRAGATGQRQLSNWYIWLNLAQREIADRAQWTFLHDTRTATIASGSTSVPLGETFKQLGTEESPVSFNYSNYRLPVKILSRAQIEGFGIWPWTNGPFSLSIPGGYMPAMVAFLETNGPGGQWAINIPPQYSVTADLVFNVSAFYYPDDLRGGNDSNAMTNDGNLATAIINRAKELAYSSEEVDNPKVEAARQLAEAAIERALYADSAKRMAGRTPRM